MLRPAAGWPHPPGHRSPPARAGTGGTGRGPRRCADQGEVRSPELAGPQLDAVGLQHQRFGVAGDVGRRPHEHQPHSAGLGLPHALGEIVVPGEQVDRVDHAGAGQAQQIEHDQRVDALLVARHHPSQPELDVGHQAQPALLGSGHLVDRAVVPVDAQQLPAAVLPGAGDQRFEERLVGAGEPGPVVRSVENLARGGPEKGGVHEDGVPGRQVIS